MKVLTQNEVLAALTALNSKRMYRVMYSSLYGGFVTDPALMLVPIDDHLVHRGDGVFEAIRFSKKSCFLLDAHLDRLARSAAAIGLRMPESKEKLKVICEDLKRESRLDMGILRLYVSRGPGDFSPNPYSTVGSQLYIVATDFKPMPAEKYVKGASLMISRVQVKPGVYSTIKSCNYLPNVMMKKDAVDAGHDFSVNFNDDGFLAEGPTENIMLVTDGGQLMAPKFDYTLRGTTLLRVFELAKSLAPSLADITLADMRKAREIMMVGTTLGVLPITKFDTALVGDGQVGPVARELNRLLMADIG
jgi:4-amino-4-deoxychorismate lyase